MFKLWIKDIFWLKLLFNWWRPDIHSFVPLSLPLPFLLLPLLLLLSFFIERLFSRRRCSVTSSRLPPFPIARSSRSATIIKTIKKKWNKNKKVYNNHCGDTASTSLIDGGGKVRTQWQSNILNVWDLKFKIKHLEFLKLKIKHLGYFW